MSEYLKELEEYKYWKSRLSHKLPYQIEIFEKRWLNRIERLKAIHVGTFLSSSRPVASPSLEGEVHLP